MSEPAQQRASDPDSLPSVSVLKELVRRHKATVIDQKQRDFAKKFDNLAETSQEAYAHLKGLNDHYKHKGYWSYFLMGLMTVLIIFQSILLGLVGGGVWDFSKYDWLLPALLVQNFAQVIGLAVFVVRALFKDQRKPEQWLPEPSNIN